MQTINLHWPDLLQLSHETELNIIDKNAHLQTYRYVEYEVETCIALIPQIECLHSSHPEVWLFPQLSFMGKL